MYRPGAVWVLLGLLVLLRIRDLVGGGQFVLVPSEAVVGVSPSVLAPISFRDFLVPGLVVFVGLGLFPVARLVRSRQGPVVGLARRDCDGDRLALVGAR